MASNSGGLFGILRIALQLVFVGFVLLAPAVTFAWDPVKDLTGRSLKGQIDHHIDKLDHATQQFLHNPLKYTVSLPGKFMAGVCATVPNLYEGTLAGQVGNWYSLPPELINAVQSQYSVDLSGVRYSKNIRTSNGDAQTFGNFIYFPYQVDLSNRDNLWVMLHELEHVVQYAHATSGSDGWICEYLGKAIGAGFQHDSMDMEQAADRKANYLIDFAYAAMSGAAQTASVAQGMQVQGGMLAPNEMWIRNETPYPVSFYLQTATFAEGLMLNPFSQQVYRGAPQDSWFFISVITNFPNGQYELHYTLSGGTQQHLAWNTNGLIDVFHSN